MYLTIPGRNELVLCTTFGPAPTILSVGVHVYGMGLHLLPFTCFSHKTTAMLVCYLEGF